MKKRIYCDQCGREVTDHPVFDEDGKSLTTWEAYELELDYLACEACNDSNQETEEVLEIQDLEEKGGE